MKVCLFLSAYNSKLRTKTSDIDQLCTLGKLLYLPMPKSLSPNKWLENNVTSISYSQTQIPEYNEIIFFQLPYNNRKHPARSLRQAISGSFYSLFIFHSFILSFDMYLWNTQALRQFSEFTA